MLVNLSAFSDLSLLFLRVVVFTVFASSGWGHLTQPQKRGKTIGLSPTLTVGLGIWELAGALSVFLGIYLQIGALMLGLVMGGAIYKKIFVWKTGYFQNQTGGWHYDAIFLAINFLLATKGGGAYVLID